MDSPARHDRPFVLLTGGTGLVGGLLLARLLHSGIPVALLVRGNRRQSGFVRVEAMMRRLEARFERLFVRPVVLEGDLCRPELGLSDSDLQWLATNCGSVIHSAANLLFRPADEHPENEPYKTNVDGTRHLLDVVTATHIAEWHYVSTAYVAGLRSGLILEQESNVGQQFGNDYERSKVIAEEMLQTSPAIRSLTVYRPSIVIDLHPKTSMRSDQTINSAFMMYQTLSRRFGLLEHRESFRRLGFSGEERKNIVTVDWVAAMIVEIYRRPALHGSTYHLTNPNGTSVSHLEDGFRAALLSSGAEFPPQPASVTALIDKQAAPFVAAFKPYFKDDPEFDRTNTIRALDVCGASDQSELTVENLRDFCMRQTQPAVLTGLSGDAAGRSVWKQFVLSTERSSGLLNHDATHRSTLIGLELSGHDGGQWLVEQTANGISLQQTTTLFAPVCWITTARTMNELIDDQLSVRRALESGRLMLEANLCNSGTTPERTAEQAEQLIGQFERLITEVHRSTADFHGRRSEVAYVR
jgi:thioester reductase-like protein